MLDTARSLAVVGCGTMGEAIVAGLLREGWVDPSSVIATARRKERLARLAAEHGIQTADDNVRAVADAEVVLLCLKPQGVLELVADARFADAVKGKLVISIAAGIDLDRLVASLPGTQVVRAMPNTPCTVGRGMTVLARSASVRRPGDAETRTSRRTHSGRVTATWSASRPPIE